MQDSLKKDSVLIGQLLKQGSVLNMQACPFQANETLLLESLKGSGQGFRHRAQNSGQRLFFE